MIWVILSVVYFLSAILVWRYMHLVFSDKGKWGNLTTGYAEIVITLTPVVNTIACLFCWLLQYPIKRESKNCNKFFNIKK